MRIVVKVGTSTLAHATGRLNIQRMERLCKVLSDLKNAGHEIILVSSGAIGMGVGKLSLSARPKDMPTKQAAAAIGQCELMYIYDKLFSEYNHIVAQLLITARLQQVAQRLRFVQGQPTVQERPTRELARQSLPRTRPQAGIQHAARDQNAAVAGYFRHILPGKGVRCGEQGAQPVIQYTSRLVRRQDIPPDRHTGGVVGQRPAGARAEQPRSDRRRIRTGQPDDRNAALSKGRCHSGNRIKKSVGTHTSSQKEGRPPNGKSALLALLYVVVPVGNV